MVRQRREDELYVTVPSLFRCPISMDVMKSPVSLSTGVTYDRSSIEKWLSLGHNTCPATMQTLSSTHTTPNLTLRRLIHHWISQSEAATTLHSEASKQTAVDVINGTEFDSDSVNKLIDFMNVSEENLNFIAHSRDSVSRLVDALAKSGDIHVSERIVEILELISRANGAKEMLNRLILKSDHNGECNCMSSFTSILQRGTVDAKIKSAKILEVIAVNPESQRKIAETEALLGELYRLCDVEMAASAAEGGFSALLAISTSRQAKKDLVRLGIVGTVAKFLSLPESSVRAVTGRALAVLESVATCTEGRAAIGGNEECVAGIVRSLRKCSGAATEHGIIVLWRVICLARDSAAPEMVTKVNGLTKVLLVLQSDCTLHTRKMCGELVKILKEKQHKFKSNLATTHITPY